MRERVDARQHQQFLRLRQHHLAAKQAKRIATRGRHRPKLEATALLAGAARPPHHAFSSSHTGNVARAMIGQVRAIGNLHPQLGHEAEIVQHQTFLEDFTNLNTPVGKRAVKNQFAQAVARPEP